MFRLGLFYGLRNHNDRALYPFIPSIQQSVKDKGNNVDAFIEQFLGFFDERNVSGDELTVIIAALMAELFYWLNINESRDQMIMAASMGIRARRIKLAADNIKETREPTRH